MIKSIRPNWSIPNNVKAFTTTRLGGVSAAPLDSLNMGSRNGDCLEHVSENRRRLIQTEQIPSEPYWLHQTHSTVVIDLSAMPLKVATGLINTTETFDGDASYTHQPKQVSVVLTADCMPVLFCSRHGDEVAAAHAGWRGLCNGILEETIKKFSCPRSDIVAWMGPAISAKKFEVGQEVKTQFEAVDSEASKAFKLINNMEQKYLADLYLIARQRLLAMGMTSIYGGNYCTYREADKFYSYRRESKTGRMASMIWFE